MSYASRRRRSGDRGRAERRRERPGAASAVAVDTSGNVLLAGASAGAGEPRRRGRVRGELRPTAGGACQPGGTSSRGRGRRTQRRLRQGIHRPGAARPTVNGQQTRRTRRCPADGGHGPCSPPSARAGHVAGVGGRRRHRCRTSRRAGSWSLGGRREGDGTAATHTGSPVNGLPLTVSVHQPSSSAS